MAGVVLETLSTRKLTVLVLALLLGLIGFFLVGGLSPFQTETVTPAMPADSFRTHAASCSTRTFLNIDLSTTTDCQYHVTLVANDVFNCFL